IINDHSSTMAFEQEVYCATCGAEFTQLRDLEFHQSVHDVKFGTSELDRLWHKDQTGAEEVIKISKPCPKCRAPLQKNNTGDQMICPRCPPQHDEASYPNSTIRHGNYYDYPAINNTMQASGALVHGTVPQRGHESTAGPTAFWQLLLFFTTTPPEPSSSKSTLDPRTSIIFMAPCRDNRQPWRHRAMWELRVLLIKPPTTRISASWTTSARQNWIERKDQQADRGGNLASFSNFASKRLAHLSITQLDVACNKSSTDDCSWKEGVVHAWDSNWHPGRKNEIAEGQESGHGSRGLAIMRFGHAKGQRAEG
ncbi:unnamed protein product, partial [Aureobasidium pullulans]